MWSAWRGLLQNKYDKSISKSRKCKLIRMYGESGVGIMNKQDYIYLYWKNYISIEKEFTQTLNYVSLAEENYDTYSSAYIKILLQLGSEIDIVAKSYCQYLDKEFKGDKMSDYRSEIIKRKTDFSTTEVKILQSRTIFSVKPWESWGIVKEDNTAETPNWWKAYNKVKHDRYGNGCINNMERDYYKFANLEYTLYSLAGLYQLLIYFYFDLAKEDRIQVPLPGSRMFALSGGKWDDMLFYQDSAFYIDPSNGHFYMQSGSFAY